jgi:hypothetical protein
VSPGCYPETTATTCVRLNPTLNPSGLTFRKQALEDLTHQFLDRLLFGY